MKCKSEHKDKNKEITRSGWLSYSCSCEMMSISDSCSSSFLLSSCFLSREDIHRGCGGREGLSESSRDSRPRSYPTPRRRRRRRPARALLSPPSPAPPPPTLALLSPHRGRREHRLRLQPNPSLHPSSPVAAAGLGRRATPRRRRRRTAFPRASASGLGPGLALAAVCFGRRGSELLRVKMVRWR